MPWPAFRWNFESRGLVSLEASGCTELTDASLWAPSARVPQDAIPVPDPCGDLGLDPHGRWGTHPSELHQRLANLAFDARPHVP